MTTRLTSRNLLAYGALGLPLAGAALPIYVHLPNLYGGTLGMNLAVLGVVLLAARLADACIDPLLGALNDRLQRPKTMIAAGIGLMVMGVLLAFNPPHAGNALWPWLSIALVPVYLGYSMASVGYLAWGSLLGHTAHERTRVSAFREGFGLAGVVLASVLPAVLAAQIDEGLARFSVMFAVAAFLCAALTLGAAPLPSRPAGRHSPGVRAMLAPFSNAAFRRLFGVFMLNGIASALPATLVLFFVADALQLPGEGGFFLTVYFVAGAASLPVWVAVSRRIGKPAAWLGAMLASVVAFAGAFALGAGDSASFAAVCALSGLALGADLALPPAMLADAIRDAGHEERAGAYFGAWTFATKLNLAIAAGVALPLLALHGYVPGDPSTVRPLYYAYCLLPCALKLAAAYALLKTTGIAVSRRGVPA